MGSVFSKPKMPQKSEEQIAAEKAAKEQAEKDKFAEERRVEDQERKKRSNLLGTRSLQDEDLQGFTGFRRNMGTTPSKGKSIRY
tara:strand:+ start:491 stop:742 length:252 start_codon:yes stop_codon:yes gene_type:complete